MHSVQSLGALKQCQQDIDELTRKHKSFHADIEESKEDVDSIFQLTTALFNTVKTLEGELSKTNKTISHMMLAMIAFVIIAGYFFVFGR